jgi:hypothetical protein
MATRAIEISIGVQSPGKPIAEYRAEVGGRRVAITAIVLPATKEIEEILDSTGSRCGGNGRIGGGSM